MWVVVRPNGEVIEGEEYETEQEAVNMADDLSLTWGGYYTVQEKNDDIGFYL